MLGLKRPKNFALGSCWRYPESSSFETFNEEILNLFLIRRYSFGGRFRVTLHPEMKSNVAISKRIPVICLLPKKYD